MGFVNRIGRFFFNHRDKLPVPLAVCMVKCAQVSKKSLFLGLPFILAGQTARIWSLMHIGPSTRARVVCADKLITSGPYAYCRNPLYFANLLKVIGLLTIAGNIPLAIAGFFFYLIEFSFIIPYEESFLSKKFPKKHWQYRQKVPLFVPKLSAIKEFDTKAKFTFWQAVKSEQKTFVSTALMIFTLLTCMFYRRVKK